MNSHSHTPSRGEPILTSVAESIGSTLGTIAAKAGAVQKAFTKAKAPAGKPLKRNARKSKSSRTKRRGQRTAAAQARPFPDGVPSAGEKGAVWGCDWHRNLHGSPWYRHHR